MATPVEQWKVEKDPRGTIPRTVSYTVDPIDGEYTFTVLIIDDIPHCMQHGVDCDHAKAVRDYLAKPKGKR